MNCELDHVFVCVSVGGEEASALTAFGLNEGPPNVHPGQGTACRRFFFANSYLELVWVSDIDEVQAELIQATQLWERWKNRTNGACPFGLGFGSKGEYDSGAPFSTWEYRPPYLPTPLSLQIATSVGILTEPMLFYLPSQLRPRGNSGAKHSPMMHRVALRELTRVELFGPQMDALSPEITTVTRLGLVQLSQGPEYLAELGFDGESQGQQADFRPSLPLVFRW